METKLVDIHGIKKGSYMMIDGVPSRVVSVKASAPGKHGHAKFRINAVGMVDNKKREIIKPGGTKMEVPIIEKKDAQIISISGNTANAMCLETYETFEIEIPEELKDKIKENSTVLYWKIGNVKKIKQVRG